MPQTLHKRFSGWEWSALAGYAVLLAVAAPRHVFWADETQSWIIARDCSLSDIFLHRMHYEGTPGLWALVLWVLQRLHLPFASMHWAAAIAAIGGAAVWLRYAPLPRVLKLLFPFTFFMAYQYAVVARSYALFPLLVFAACALICNARPRPVLLAAVLGLLANLCMFGTAAAAGLTLVAMSRVWRSGSWKPLRGRYLSAFGLVCAAAVIAALTAWPAKDVAFTTGILDLPSVQRALHREQAAAVSAEADDTSAAASAPDDAALLPPPVTGSRIKDKLWRASHSEYLGAPAVVHHVYLVERVIFAASLLKFPIAGSVWLAYALVLALLYRCIRQRDAAAMLPFLFVFLASVAIYAAEHHSGLLLVSLMAGAWLTWPAAVPARGVSRWMEFALQGLMLVVFVVQIGWTVHAVCSERRTDYSGDRQAAVFLQQNAAGKKVAGYYTMSDGIELYFPRNIYINQPSSYWQYSSAPGLLMSNADVLAAHPDYVVIGTTAFRDQVILNQIVPMLPAIQEYPGDYQGVEAYFAQHGYHETHRFCGMEPMRSGVTNELCQIVLEPKN